MQETDDMLPEDKGRAGRRPWLLALLVIAATALAVWLVPEEETEQPAVAMVSPPAAVRGSVPRAGPPAAQPAPTAPAAAETRPGAQARELIAKLRKGGDDAVGQAFEEARLQQRAGHPEDAYLLYFFAARKGHPGAALALGSQADPAHFTPGNGVLDQPDPAQAYKWYRVAADGGSTEAGSRLAALHEQLRAAAQTGDEEAGRLLLQWQ